MVMPFWVITRLSIPTSPGIPLHLPEFHLRLQVTRITTVSKTQTTCSETRIGESLNFLHQLRLARGGVSQETCTMYPVEVDMGGSFSIVEGVTVYQKV